jgi:microcompartment protein CcmL/EutN
MSQQAIGMIETRGLVALKSIKGEVISVHVIARPHSDVEAVLPKKK